MQKRISKPLLHNVRGRKDSNQIAFQTIQRTIEASEAPAQPDAATISAVMKALGAKGGKIGGKRRLETMTAQERSDVALRAARTRWSKKRKG